MKETSKLTANTGRKAVLHVYEQWIFEGIESNVQNISYFRLRGALSVSSKQIDSRWAICLE